MLQVDLRSFRNINYKDEYFSMICVFVLLFWNVEAAGFDELNL